jgi:hypothetical protein
VIPSPHRNNGAAIPCGISGKQVDCNSERLNNRTPREELTSKEALPKMIYGFAPAEVSAGGDISASFLHHPEVRRHFIDYLSQELGQTVCQNRVKI